MAAIVHRVCLHRLSDIYRRSLLTSAAQRQIPSNYVSKDSVSGITTIINDIPPSVQIPSNCVAADCISDGTTDMPPSVADSYVYSPLYMDLGDCTNICEFCGALFWFPERLLSVPLHRRPKYSTCCRGGKVVLPFPSQPPYAIKNLFADRRFHANVRAYNSMFSMTSFGANVDDSINNGAGEYVFKVAGQISHWVGSLCPPPGDNPRFLQLYIYDTNNEVSNRLRFFSAGEDSQISPTCFYFGNNIGRGYKFC